MTYTENNIFNVEFTSNDQGYIIREYGFNNNPNVELFKTSGTYRSLGLTSKKSVVHRLNNGIWTPLIKTDNYEIF